MNAETGGSTKRSIATWDTVTTTNASGSIASRRSQRRQRGAGAGAGVWLSMSIQDPGMACRLPAVPARLRSRDGASSPCAGRARTWSIGKPPSRPHPVSMDTTAKPSSTASGDDLRGRFLLPQAGVRGVYVRLRRSWGKLLSHADYPPAARTLLGEAMAAAALFTGHVKVDGRLSIQVRAGGPLRTLFAECTAAGSVRGIVRLDEGTDAPRAPADRGEDALLAVTIENPGLDPREPQRYQSLVALDAAHTLAGAFEDYFRQSEQLPTRLCLAADGQAVAGLMLQKLPGEQGEQADADGWDRASALFDTLGEAELLATAPTLLVHRLFHQEAP